MSLYDVYGFKNSEISAVVDLSSLILKVSFIARTSSYKGNYFLSSDKKYEIYPNQIGENDWRCDEFKEFRILLDVNNSFNQDLILRILLESEMEIFHLFRTEVIPGQLIRKYRYIDDNFVLEIEKKLRR